MTLLILNAIATAIGFILTNAIPVDQWPTWINLFILAAIASQA